MEPVTKRLHVSGLTPSISSSDLSQRLSSFGTVKALDGFGQLDGIGRPRKFGYVTMETTQGQLTKCLNVLSGSTWKGTKLRIGEAKPDYYERLAAERAEEVPPKKKLKRVHVATHTQDMSLVTPSNASSRSGWRVTPLGRLIRPMRMRPDRPLPPQEPFPSIERTKGKAKAKVGGKKPRRGIKAPPVRARRRTIDPTRWNSTHLKGAFLDGGGGRSDKPVTLTITGQDPEIDDRGDDSSQSGGTTEGDNAEEKEDIGTGMVRLPVSNSVKAPQLDASLTPVSISHEDVDIAEEKKQTLELLQTLFRDKDDMDWMEKESVGSDVDEEDSRRHAATSLQADMKVDFEEVPMGVSEEAPSVAKTVDHETPLEEKLQSAAVEKTGSGSGSVTTQNTKLKDLFAPREEDAGFSLLNHLELDLELDDETLTGPVIQAPDASTSVVPSRSTAFDEVVQSRLASTSATTFSLDTRRALFFPASSTTRARDLFTVAEDESTGWRQAKFYRTGTEDEIRKRWEDGKVELTREWKRRWREAVKIRRRRGGDNRDGE